MARASIRRRLIASVIATQLLLTITLVSLATYLTRRQLRTAFDAALHGRAMSLAAAVRYSEGPKPALQFYRESAPPSLEREDPDLYRITDEQGGVIAISPNWNDDVLSPARPNRNYWNASLHDTHYRVIRLAHVPVLDQEDSGTVSAATLTVYYAAPTSEMREHAWTAAWLTLAGSAVLLTLATLVAVWAIGKGLSPLAALASGAASVSVANWRLDAPASAAGTQELAPLTAAMQTMLATLHQAFTSQREFLANAAHELKTPVAVLKSTLQSLLQRPRSAEEYRSSLDGALEDVERLEKLIHSMLRLARAEQAAMDGAKRNCLPLDLNASCEQALERLKPLAEAHAVALEIIPSRQDVPVAADPEDLDLIWANLLENAIRYSDRGACVRVTISAQGGDAEVAVQDWGAGIPEADLPHIFDRFHRADTSRTRATGGYGLGLAIAKAMAESYHGNISVRSKPGEGTTMIVRLPGHDH